jgi:cyclopropane-fatty-acyl-phospholipid synthase
MLLQAIVIKDQLFARHASSVDFIGKYIFPGGFLPSVAAISDAVARVTDFRIYHLEEFSHHYVRTLQLWRERFWDRIREVKQLDFDERFIRMWDYYLQYCEAAFAERQVNVVQVLLAKPEWRTHDRRLAQTSLPAVRRPAGAQRELVT